MSAEYDAALEIKAGLDNVDNTLQAIASALAKPRASGEALERLDRIEAVLLDLYPDSCDRHGITRPAGRPDASDYVDQRPGIIPKP